MNLKMVCTGERCHVSWSWGKVACELGLSLGLSLGRMYKFVLVCTGIYQVYLKLGINSDFSLLTAGYDVLSMGDVCIDIETSEYCPPA